MHEVFKRVVHSYKSGTPRNIHRAPVYAVFQVNSIYDDPSIEKNAALAFPNAEVIVQFFDAIDGDLLYTESVEIASE